MIAVYPLVFVLIGLLLYFFVPKAKEIGLATYVCAFLVLMFTLATHSVKFLAK